MRTLVYGAGPLGSYYAAKLHAAGEDVALLARRQRLADLREHGVVLEHWRTGARETYDVPVVEELDEDFPYDLVLVVMRKDQCRDILPTLAGNPHAHTVLFLQNNPAGFEEYTDALGAERVMVGFPSLGGERHDPVMRIMPLAFMPTPIGEVDGRVTDRTKAVAALLERTGKRVEIRRDMDAWLVTHIPAIAGYFGLFAADLDSARLARTRDAMLLGIRARAEALRAQQAAGIPVSPPSFRAIPWLPEPLAVATLRAMIPTAFFEVGVAGHCRVAREELVHLLAEYRQRIAPGSVPTPTLDRLADHVEGTVPPLPDGARDEPLRWGGVTALGAAVAAAIGLGVLRRRR